ncbi:hypothetical protein [Nocardioides hwasunensis]|uniref:Uncharacterized protein n=1 Tax=Nocardioides hwasunensis TaxID=397258 RepID=A0ABR8MFH9_9ACTN|nr:hypothetical protein [Nocardioides hwasunensis]MBD3913244.1 hypothetical protein [Nocardioides hwasunensis]
MDSSPGVPAIGRDPDASEACYVEHLPWTAPTAIGRACEVVRALATS